MKNLLQILLQKLLHLSNSKIWKDIITQFRSHTCFVVKQTSSKNCISITATLSCRRSCLYFFSLTALFFNSPDYLFLRGFFSIVFRIVSCKIWSTVVTFCTIGHFAFAGVDSFFLNGSLSF